VSKRKRREKIQQKIQTKNNNLFWREEREDNQTKESIFFLIYLFVPTFFN
jgi:hypothetical protein